MDEIEKVISEYQLAEHAPCILLRESSDNRVYTAGSTNKKILRIGKKLSVPEIHFEHQALRTLEEKAVPVPKLILTKSGDIYVETVEGEVAVMFSFVEGYHANFDGEVPISEHTFTAGATLGMIAKAGEDFIPEHARARTVYSELERALTLRNEIETSLEGGAQLIEEIKSILELTKETTSPYGLLHNDFRPGNVFFADPKTVSGVIDFDWSCMGPLIKDLAHGAMEWSFKDGESAPNQEAFDNFIAGYNSTAIHSFTDMREIYLWTTQSALADTATFFCDRLNTDSTVRKLSSSYMYRKYLYFSDKYRTLA
ncbi:MAG: phosphotransferase [Candidatus Pacebacteria bacterium]|nr:phosphotransferase [Candidatus Paceibacterota bacterium]